MHRRTAALTLALSAAIALGGCSSGAETEPTSSPSTHTAAPTTEEPTTEEPTTAEPTTAEPTTDEPTATAVGGCQPITDGDGIADQPILASPASVVVDGEALSSEAFTQTRCYAGVGTTQWAAGDETNGFTVDLQDSGLMVVDVFRDGAKYTNFTDILHVERTEAAVALSGNLYDSTMSGGTITVELTLPVE